MQDEEVQTFARTAEATTEVKMKYRTTPYILEKDGIYYSFPSEKAACDFLKKYKKEVTE